MRRSSRLAFAALAAALALTVSGASALAQDAPTVAPKVAPKVAKAKPSAHHKPDPYQSPLATIMSSHLWTTEPEPQDFVRASRPTPKSLDYTPLTSQVAPDPVRPKPRDAANVLALQAELEASMSQNTTRAKGLGGVTKPRRTKPSASAP